MDFFQISGFVNWLMRTVSEAEMYFTSVERVAEFTTVEAEPLYHDKGGGDNKPITAECSDIAQESCT